MFNVYFIAIKVEGTKDKYIYIFIDRTKNMKCGVLSIWDLKSSEQKNFS